MRDLSIDSLRFLSTDQSVADMAYFAKNVVFDGLERLDLTAPSTPYIAYGGSYAGAFVAFLRKLYPDVYWGAISSSGVTEAIYDYWQYYEAARLFLPQDCVETTQKLINVVDNILLDQNQQGHAQEIKDLFGLGNITRNDDFASAVSVGVTGLQSTNWDPALNSTSVGVYCQNVSSDTPLYSNSHLESKVRKLLVAAGYGDELGTLTTRMLNYIGYIGVRVVSRCGGPSQDECFSNYDSTFYKQDDIKQTWRSWPWQYCTEWGYLQSGSGVPADQLPLISRLIDLNYSSVVCKEAFNITTKPNVESINKHGGFNFSYPRLAIIDGEADPWRAATPHAIGLPSRPNTISEPFLLIEKGVHHWDENGLFANETTEDLPPKSVRDVQNAEVEFVREWIKEWNSTYRPSSLNCECTLANHLKRREYARRTLNATYGRGTLMARPSVEAIRQDLRLHMWYMPKVSWVYCLQFPSIL